MRLGDAAGEEVGEVLSLGERKVGISLRSGFEVRLGLTCSKNESSGMTATDSAILVCLMVSIDRIGVSLAVCVADIGGIKG